MQKNYDRRKGALKLCLCANLRALGEPLAKLAIQPNFSVQAVGNGGWLAATSGMIGVWKP
jgi:hypothetical protein